MVLARESGLDCPRALRKGRVSKPSAFCKNDGSKPAGRTNVVDYDRLVSEHVLEFSRHRELRGSAAWYKIQ